jgi:hypothetical protein
LALLRRVLAAGVALAFIAAVSDPADAATRKRQQGVAVKASKTREESKGPFGDIPKGPLQVVVSIGQQHATLYSNGVRVAQTPVSTGTPGHPTPFGVFSVIEKDRFHRSNLYNSAPMYYMHRLTWSGIAMHEGMLPGYAASHGCIRMPTGFVSKLWTISKLGVRVIVARNDVAPHDFEHAKLFNPKPKPPENQVSELPFADGLRPTLAATDRPIQMAQAAALVATDGGSAADGSEQQLPTLPDPLGETTPLVTTESAPAVVAPEAVVEPGPVQRTETSSPADVETTAATPAAPAAPVAETPAAAPAEQAPKASVVPAATETPASNEIAKPVPLGAEPSKPGSAKSRAASEPNKRTGQVAVFVSKKEKKIFVRQGFVPVFDMPIEITNPDQPLGTHVFTALELLDGGSKMRWNAISMAGEQPRTVDNGGKKNGKKSAAEPAPRKTAEAKAASSAAEALERIQFPQEAIDRIAEVLTPGSSLVVSDEGLGRETGRYTEFIVLTR